MQKERPVMVLASFCRFHINFSKKACKKEGFEIGDEREYGIAQFFFAHSMRSNVHRRRKCLRLLWKKKDLNFLAGELFR